MHSNALFSCHSLITALIAMNPKAYMKGFFTCYRTFVSPSHVAPGARMTNHPTKSSIISAVPGKCFHVPPSPINAHILRARSSSPSYTPLILSNPHRHYNLSLAMTVSVNSSPAFTAITPCYHSPCSVTREAADRRTASERHIDPVMAFPPSTHSRADGRTHSASQPISDVHGRPRIEPVTMGNGGGG